METEARIAQSKDAKEARNQRHNENLHGRKGTWGLTGFYKGTYYERGTPRVPLEIGGVTELVFNRVPQVRGITINGNNGGR